MRTSEGQLTAQRRDSEWMGGRMPGLDLAGRRSGGGAERRFMDAVKRGRGVSCCERRGLSQQMIGRGDSRG